MNNLKQILIKINRQSGGLLGLIKNDINYLQNFVLFKIRVMLNRPLGPDLILEERQLKAIDDLKKNGYTIIPKVFLKEADLLLQEFDSNIALANVANFLDDREFSTTGKRRYINPSQTSVDLIATFREQTNNIQIKNPVDSCKTVSEISSLKFITDIAFKYLGVNPIDGPHNFRISFANGLKENDTQLFHQDKNAFKVLKFFIYINDVDINGGPFQYVKKTNRFLQTKLRRFHRINEKDVNHYFPNSSIPIVANKGDLIIADTTGIHRGLKPRLKDRVMLTLTFRSN
jgi:hypothetical protein